MPDEGLRKELVRLMFVCVMQSCARRLPWTRSHQRVLVECVCVINGMPPATLAHAHDFFSNTIEVCSLVATRCGDCPLHLRHGDGQAPQCIHMTEENKHL